MCTYTLKQLQTTVNDAQVGINGKYVPARGINYQYRTLKERIVEAWKVFKGEYDTFTWPGGQ